MKQTQSPTIQNLEAAFAGESTAGYGVLKELRKRGNTAPVVVLSADDGAASGQRPFRSRRGMAFRPCCPADRAGRG